jgi:ketosteroid isomerase-like protein
VPSDAVTAVHRMLRNTSAEDYAVLPDYLDPEVVWYGTRGGLDESRVMHGREAAIEYLREVQEPWERFNLEIERTMELGDTVVVFLHESGRTRHGGPELHNHTAMVFRTRDGKIVEITGYLDRDEALRAAGAQKA